MTSGTGAINISADAAATTVNFATGAAAKTVAVGSTTAGSSLALQTPAGTAVTAAAGLSVTTAGRGVYLPGTVALLSGTGSPNTVVTAAKGSVFLRTDGASADEVLYVNTDGTTAWTALTST